MFKSVVEKKYLIYSKTDEHFNKLAVWINQEQNELDAHGILQIQDVFNSNLIADLKELNTQPPSLTLYRGLYWPDLKTALTVSNAVLKKEPKIGDTITYKDSGASSWSVSRKVAYGFAQGAEFGIVIQAKIMPEDVICYIPAMVDKLKDLVAPARKEDLSREKEVIVQGGVRHAKIVDIYRT